MKIIGLLVLAFVMSGCAALAAPGIEGAASLAGMAGNSATGYMSTHSSIELNAANVELVRAQAQMQKVQADDLRNKREELENERAATVGILREWRLRARIPRSPTWRCGCRRAATPIMRCTTRSRDRPRRSPRNSESSVRRF